MNEHVLTGLDGSNPLGFLAALGVLRVLDDLGEPVSMRWALDGVWRPVLRIATDRDGLLDRLDGDRARWVTELALDLSYAKEGGPGDTRDLKPRPADLRDWLERLLKEGSGRSLALVAAFFTETALDGAGNLIKPTALHFTAGQQQFLVMARELQARVTREDLDEALFGPWRYARELPVFGWDSSASRDYALRASDPSKEKKTGVPGADWLGLMGLAFLPVAPVGERVLTPGWAGSWKEGSWSWPIWSVPLGAATVRSLLLHPKLRELSAERRAARGIAAVYVSGVRRSDQGGYGSFRPARPC